MASDPTTLAKTHGIATQRTWRDEGDFAAYRAALVVLTAAGFSAGRTAAGQPCGILWGDYDIQKWHNLTQVHRLGLHGVMTGDRRAGPVTVTIFGNAPSVAIEAMRAVVP